ncbi:DUF4738 domain-containing protein [Algibacter sp. PT7-4]|uniref:DUF4738 domain-containing protein n=1 Tax=Algibacter ulvanivorans TaxID=3400999 RepID=UPI003AAEE072
MFKQLYHNTFSIFFITTLIAFLSCDGRDKIYKTNAQVLIENNQYKTFSEKIIFIPHNKVEIHTDTILSSGFQIKIKYASIKDSFVLKTKNNKNKVTNTYYKNFEAKLHVLKNGLTINQSVINKKLFSNFEKPSFWQNAIMQYVWINHDISTKNEVFINTSFYIPNTKSYKDFVLKINSDGTLTIKNTNRITNTV